MAPNEVTTRERIRDAALLRFATQGYARTHLKDIAAAVGVTTPLITHHFGSKNALRAECDRHVAALIKEQKTAGIDNHPDADLLQRIRAVYVDTPILEYLARALSEQSPQVDELVDLIVEDAVEYTERAVEQGMIRPHPRLREQVIALTIWQLGAMSLHHHVARLTGVDLLGGDEESLLRWTSLLSEILTHGVIEPDYYDRLTRVLDPSQDPIEHSHHGGTT